MKNVPVRNVSPRSVVTILFGQSEINQEELVTVTADSHEEVVRLDVSVDEVLVVDKLDSADHLVGQHEDRLHGEASRAEVEEVFERRAQEVHDEDVVVTFGAVPPDVGDADTTLKDLVKLRLVEKLWVPSLDRFKLKRNVIPSSALLCQ